MMMIIPQQSDIPTCTGDVMHTVPIANRLTLMGDSKSCRSAVSSISISLVQYYRVSTKSFPYYKETTWNTNIFFQLLLNHLNPELNPICYLLVLLGAHHFLHVSRIRVKLLTLRLLMSYIYIYMEHPFLMFLDRTQRRSTVGRTPLDE